MYKMKWLYLAVILLLGVLLCKASKEQLQDVTNNDNIEDELRDVRKLLKNKCIQVGGDKAFNNLVTAFKGVRDCLEDCLPDTAEELTLLKDSSEGSSDDICTEKRMMIRQCFNSTFFDALERCSEPDEKYIHHFLFDAIKGVLNYVCADEDAFLEKIIFSMDCLSTLKEQINKFEGTCSSKLKFLRNDIPEDTTITKVDLCADLATAKTCAGNIIQEKCPGSDFNDLVAGVFTAIISACDERHKRSVPLSFRVF